MSLNGPIAVLLDSGIFCHSEFGEGAAIQNAINWGGKNHVTTVHGVRRKAPNQKPGFQKQIEALPTIGRLIRENVIRAYEYMEIWCESMRFRPLLPFGNALRDCTISKCDPPVDRSKFMQTADVTEYFAKGGKKDRKRGVATGTVSQIAFLKTLCGLGRESVDVLVPHSQMLRLTPFEIESLQNLSWFQFLCQRCGSAENYPDVFHLWTAERNRLDVLLTLDNGLPELVSRVRREKKTTIEIKTQVLQPLELLDRIGIKERDPVGLEAGRFYYLHELD